MNVIHRRVGRQFWVACYLSILTLVLGISAACGSEEAGETIVWEVIGQGTGGSIMQRHATEMIVIDHQQAFDRIWHEYTGKPPLVVDFARYRVALIDMGEQRSGGYALQVSGVKEFASQVELSVAFKHPGRGCATIAMITHPYAFVRVNTLKPLVLNKVDQVVPCR